MIRLKNAAEIAKIKDASIILSETFAALKSLIQEGITTAELDTVARNFIESRGAKPSFLGYLNYPASICISINEEVIHGIPGRRKLKEGDRVGLDLGVNLNGYFSDAAATYAVGKTSREREKLLKLAEGCLYRGIDQAVVGNRINDISGAIQKHAQENGMEVVRRYCGHGVGFSPHEDPQIPNYISTGPNPRLKPGMVLALEPMVNEGTWEVKILEDNWTVVTVDHSDSAHFEHTIAILKDRTEILTSFDSKRLGTAVR